MKTNQVDEDYGTWVGQGAKLTSITVTSTKTLPEFLTSSNLAELITKIDFSAI